MTPVRFKANVDGFREIRYSGPVQDMLEAVGLTVADAANSTLKLNGARDVSPGYEVKSQAGRRVKQGRWRVSVTAVTRHAIRHNAVHNTLIRALGGASQ
jgi:hypothetical protein